MTAPALICATAEVALNRYLRLEHSALDECAALDGKALAVQISDLGWTFIIEPHAGGVRVASTLEREPDVRVTAPSLRLAKLALLTARGAPGLPAGLDVQGDTELLARFNALLTRVGFDPEELAAKFVGDAAAHRVVGGIKNLFGFGRTAVQRLSLDTAEYLTEETEDLARAADVSEWMEAVDGLREGADRLEARLLRLERAAGGSA